VTDALYLLIGLPLGLAVLVAIFFIQRRRITNEKTTYSWLDYLLVWPLFLDVDRSKRGKRVLTAREWIGWSIVLLVAVLAIILT
jgi:hypothetical protein